MAAQYEFNGCMTARGPMRMVIITGNYVLDELPPEDRFTVIEPRSPLLTLGTLKKEISDDDAELTVDSITIEFNDSFVIHTISDAGVEDGPTNISTTVHASVFDWIFENLIGTFSTTYCRVFLIRTRLNGTEEICFNGYFDPRKIERERREGSGIMTSSEVSLPKLTLNVNPMSEFLDTLTIGQLKATILASDVIAAPFYCGWTCNRNISEDPAGLDFERWSLGPDAPPEGDGIGTNIIVPGGFVMRSDDFVPSPLGDDYFGLLDGAVFGQVGFFGIDLATLVMRIAYLAGMSFNPATDIEGEFWHYWQTYDPTIKRFRFRVNDCVKDARFLYVNYNFLLGVDPANHSKSLSSPITFEADQSVGELLRDICLWTGTYVEIDYDQTNGRTNLILRNWTNERGGMPTNWQPTVDPEQTHEIELSKDYLVAKYKGDSGEYRFPSNSSGDPIQKEFRWRTWSFGYATRDTGNHSLGIVKKHILHDWGIKSEEYYDKLNLLDILYDDGGIPANYKMRNTEVWRYAAYMYVFVSGRGNFAYPSGFYANNGGKYLHTPVWEDAFYSVGYMDRGELRESALESGTWYTGVDDNRYDSRYTHGQFYAKELLGDTRPFELSFSSSVDDSDNLRTVGPGYTQMKQLAGITRKVRLVSCEIDIIEDRVSTSWRTASLQNLSDYSFRFVSGDNTSSTRGAGDSETSGTSSAKTTGYIVEHPTTADQNTILPKIDMVNLNLKVSNGQTANVFTISDLSDNVLAFVNVNGQAQFPKVTGRQPSGGGDTFIASQPANLPGKAFQAIDYTNTTTTYIDFAGNASFATNVEVGLTLAATTVQASGKVKALTSTVSGDPSSTCTTKDYVDNLVATGSGMVTLTPATSSRNKVVSSSSSVPCLWLSPEGAGSPYLVFKVEGLSGIANIKMISDGRMSLRTSSTTATLNTEGVDKTVPAAIFKQGSGGSGTTSSIVQIQDDNGNPVLEVDSSQVTRQYRGFRIQTAAVNANTTLGSAHHYVLCSAATGAITITLPNAGTFAYHRYVIVKTDNTGFGVTINTTAMGNKLLTAKGQSITVFSDGSVWWIE